jgi:hypothetical protein
MFARLSYAALLEEITEALNATQCHLSNNSIRWANGPQTSSARGKGAAGKIIMSAGKSTCGAESSYIYLDAVFEQRCRFY